MGAAKFSKYLLAHFTQATRYHATEATVNKRLRRAMLCRRVARKNRSALTRRE